MRVKPKGGRRKKTKRERAGGTSRLAGELEGAKGPQGTSEKRNKGDALASSRSENVVRKSYRSKKRGTKNRERERKREREREGSVQFDTSKPSAYRRLWVYIEAKESRKRVR